MFSSNTSQVSNAAVFVEDVFSTWLYTGNGSTQTINNGIDLAGKGGLVWIKQRSSTANHMLTDTARGTDFQLSSNSDVAQSNVTTRVTAFNADGFNLGASSAVNGSGSTYASWTFREQPKFFDVVTFTTGTSLSTNRRISHSLGSVPGCILVKRTTGAQSWLVYHRSTGRNAYLLLDTTEASTSFTNAWGTSDPTSTDFGINEDALCFPSSTYVAYLFAHNAGGFGLTGTDNVISCGSFTTDGSANATVELGWEPQWVMTKTIDAPGAWYMADTMRGWLGGVRPTSNQILYANLSNAEVNSSVFLGTVTATGFRPAMDAGTTSIYIAIRRGPMRTPTTGTSVYNAITRTGTGTEETITSIGFPPDLLDNQATTVSTFTGFFDRLRGGGRLLYRALSDPEVATGQTTQFNTTMSGFAVGASTAGDSGNNNGVPYVWHALRRAPSFFDEVCYTGTSVAGRTINHNLGVAPELMIVKVRSADNDWAVYSSTLGASNILYLNLASATSSTTTWNSTAPTATVFSVGSNLYANASGQTYVAYLFASCPGVSRVGSYTGTGATQTISCGFAARFVLIKRTDSVGNWWVWDTARGMVTGTDPRLAWNTTNSQFNNDWVFTNASGFQIVTTDATVNASGGSYIYLAIA
ncbi:hypothetical protein UFOVP312_2 [uncultured Caudovirales phage]|uniref:DUF7483 domain-containing protein n=1 Tax=uncultured Caudovirales phage TaxID=2100421 RepID=A0A6J5LTZ6_9CAUD|nr:hypothetical protein UFOVP312_2 [uncultured Caudovirales phage]